MAKAPPSLMRRQPARSRHRRPEGVKLSDANKVELIPLKVSEGRYLPKPHWIRIKAGHTPAISRLKNILRDYQMVTVCEEASCPNLPECFGNGTATFMIMGDICTRRCPFCDVGHGKPKPLDQEEPKRLAALIAKMHLNYVVITSVDRDDLRDGGAQHFADCIRHIRQRTAKIQLEILTPDFRGRENIALDILAQTPPNVFNHNIETVPSLYRQARPGANYQHSLHLLKSYKAMCPDVVTKSGLMVGMGETKQELFTVFERMRAHNIDMLTIGQYLQPSREHFPVSRYVHPDEFKEYEEYAYQLGFSSVASGPLVRSSYHADQQAHAIKQP